MFRKGTMVENLSLFARRTNVSAMSWKASQGGPDSFWGEHSDPVLPDRVLCFPKRLRCRIVIPGVVHLWW